MTFALPIYYVIVQKVRDKIKDDPIWISIKVTTDKEGNHFGNALLSEQYFKRILLCCYALEKCSNKLVIKLFIEAMYILWRQSIMCYLLLVSDAAL